MFIYRYIDSKVPGNLTSANANKCHLNTGNLLRIGPIFSSPTPNSTAYTNAAIVISCHVQFAHHILSKPPESPTSRSGVGSSVLIAFLVSFRLRDFAASQTLTNRGERHGRRLVERR